MAGGLMQLVAYGAQDVYLTGNPKVTFFQAVYKRHTNFAMENIQQTVNGTSGDNGRVSVTIARNGDLVGNMYIALQPKATTNLTTSDNTAADSCWIAERAIASVELTIGGQRIDKHYQTWFRLYSECFHNEADKISYGKMTSMANPQGASSTSKPYVFMPLRFFFNRHPGMYLPLIALQYHEVRMDFDLTSYYSSYFSTSIEVWANYIYLDTEERRKFAQKGHEYLIEQVQHTGGDAISSIGEGQTNLVRLSFNHPVKEFIWCYQNTTASSRNAMWNFSTNCANNQVTVDPIKVALTQSMMPHMIGCPYLYAPATPTATTVFFIEEGNRDTTAATASTMGYEVGPLHQFKLVLNGQDRFKEQTGKYFNQYQTYMYHTGTPYVGIYNYSFALEPEEHQPTGTCNFSRIDNAQVSVSVKTGTPTATSQKLFAVNYNILRIQSGMGGLAFSN